MAEIRQNYQLKRKLDGKSFVVYLFIIAAALQLRIVDKSKFQNGAAHEIDVPTSGFRAGVFWQI